jgi:hypothetical protein
VLLIILLSWWYKQQAGNLKHSHSNLMVSL